MGLLDEPQTRNALIMVDDRNLTVHTYNEELAEDIGRRLSSHAALLRLWIDQMAVRLPSPAA